MIRTITYLLSLCFIAAATGLSAQGVSASVRFRDSSSTFFLVKGWKFSPGDDPAWAAPSFNDSAWKPAAKVRMEKIVEMPLKDISGIAWFRMKFRPDTSFRNGNAVMRMVFIGAAEVYLDGKLVVTHGKVGRTAGEEEFPSGEPEPVLLSLSPDTDHVFAVRLSAWEMMEARTSAFSNLAMAGFSIGLSDWEAYNKDKVKDSKVGAIVMGVIIGFFGTLTLLHLFLFLFFRRNRSNLYYSLFTFSLFWLFLVIGLGFIDIEGNTVNQISISEIFVPLLTISLIAFLYNQFYERMPKFLWVMLGLGILYLALDWSGVSWSALIAVLLFLGMAVESIRVVIVAMRKKKEGAWIIGLGVLVSFLFPIIAIIVAIIFALSGDFGGDQTVLVGVIVNFMMASSIVSISLAVSVYLARQFAVTNRNLERQMVQVKELSEQTIRQEQEKKRILESQKEKLEILVKERTAEVVKQKEEIAEKNERLQEAYKSITDSISYAQNIQQALLSSEELLRKNLGEYFILFLPKDIVSGDFYWSAETDGRFYLAVCDSTGHGVPGAFMSLLNMSFLKEAIIEKKILHPANAFDYVRSRLIESLSTGEAVDVEESDVMVKDGMDGILVCLERNSHAWTYAAANNPPVLIRNGSQIELGYDKMPVGKSYRRDPFAHGNIPLQPGDMLYFCTDGFGDQFGGDEGKKFRYRRLVEFLCSISGSDMDAQREALLKELEAWKGGLEQVDDILILGTRIK